MNDIDEKRLKKIFEDRAKQYGDFKENFRLLAVMFSVILQDKLKDDLEDHEAAKIMMGLKLIRTLRPYKADSYDDLQVYTKIAKELHKSTLDKEDRQMYKRERQGTCSFTYIELFDDVEKAANPNEKGKFVECKVSDVRFDFTKVKKENDGKTKTSTSEVERLTTKET